MSNWRETLFVWDGILSEKDDEEENGGGENNDNEEFVWSGTWIGYDEADATKVDIPKRGAFNEFVSSENQFEVEGTAESLADDKSLRELSMNGGSGYDLGEGKDKKKHTDDRHDMYFYSKSLCWTVKPKSLDNTVLAVGVNEFGYFVSMGVIRIGNRITLARRYVDDTDPRAKWDIDDLKKQVEDGCAVPWQCRGMHADPNQVNKRQKKRTR